MKKIIALILLVVLLAAGIAAISFAGEYFRRNSGDETVNVEIPYGASERQIASILKENGVINYELTFRVKMKFSPYRGQLNYGKYVLNKKMRLDDIVKELSKKSHKEGVTLTIPEGFSAELIAERCEKLGLFTAEEFLAELQEGDFNFDFIKDIPENNSVKYKLQGYLFPNTYVFDVDSDAHTVINTLLGEFEKQYNGIKGGLPGNMSMNEAVIRAALIEREAKLDKERRTISGVIQNRIDKGMLLQIDASVVYVITDGMYTVERVLYKDLEKDSPYNTYKYGGLPAGAICSPGIESLEAAMNPEKHNYLFYHTDTEKNDGSHIFTETFSQHKNS